MILEYKTMAPASIDADAIVFLFDCLPIFYN